MKELSFSVCNEPSNTFEILDHFNTKRPTYAQVRLHWLPWDHQKQELTAMAFLWKGNRCVAGGRTCCQRSCRDELVAAFYR